MKKQHERISAEGAIKKVKASEALLVCAYEEDEKFKSMRLEGATSYKEFKKKVIHLPKDQEIIFYCSSAQEEDANVRAREYSDQGFERVRVLGEGLKAWRKAGYRVEGEGS
jgi:rhodanese-related sulfurtransferase